VFDSRDFVDRPFLPAKRNDPRNHTKNHKTKGRSRAVVELTTLMTCRFAILLIVCLMLFGAVPSVSAQRTTSSFDHDWRFLKGDAAGAEKPDFDDSDWRKLDVPHDWSIEGPIGEKNSTGPGGGFMPSGVCWYRKHFTLESGAQSWANGCHGINHIN